MKTLASNWSVTPLKMKNFGKSKSCPSSYELVSFELGELSLNERTEIENHLETCEFCDTETNFLAHFPFGDEKIDVSEIPEALKQLAETLLGDKRKEFGILRDLLNPRAKITV